MDNYICINGKKTFLTEEQLEELGVNQGVRIFWIQKTEHVQVEPPFMKVDGVRYRIICPKCKNEFKSSNQITEANYKPHKYCGYCGAKNIFGVE